LYQAFQEAGITPDYVAGHSLGEYSALVDAKAISFSEAVSIVHKRGTYMDQAVPAGVGAMSAILHLDRDKLNRVCQEVSKSDFVVEPANFNSPGQIAISGHAEAVKVAGEKALEAGAKKVVPLSVSGPFHSSLMKPAADQLEKALEQVTIHDAQVPVVANVTARPVQSATEIRQLLIDQVASPVLWEDSIRFMVDQGVDTFVEIGEGKVLSSLVKKIHRKARILSVQNPDTLEQTIESLQSK
jgi:[acyl-carrier-protein] S-malonyltransferase